MTLNDLKTGMIVETRDGNSYIVMRDFVDSGDVLAGFSDSTDITNSYMELSDYKQDMKHDELSGLDIMSVYISYLHCIDIPKKLLWEREEYKEVTMQEIEEKFGCKVKIVGNEDEHNNGWICCSERLPKDDDCRFYMCTVENHEDDPPMYCQYDEELGFGFYNDIYDPNTLGFIDTEFKTNSELGYENVIAWMPLPEPYKESDEE